MKKALKELWDECVDIFKDNISPKPFDTWFACIEPQTFDGKQLVIAVPSRFRRCCPESVCRHCRSRG